jgi:hypothetical protein
MVERLRYLHQMRFAQRMLDFRIGSRIVPVAGRPADHRRAERDHRRRHRGAMERRAEPAAASPSARAALRQVPHVRQAPMPIKK